MILTGRERREKYSEPFLQFRSHYISLLLTIEYCITSEGALIILNYIYLCWFSSEDVHRNR